MLVFSSDPVCSSRKCSRNVVCPRAPAGASEPAGTSGQFCGIIAQYAPAFYATSADGVKFRFIMCVCLPARGGLGLPRCRALFGVCRALYSLHVLCLLTIYISTYGCACLRCAPACVCVCVCSCRTVDNAERPANSEYLSTGNYFNTPAACPKVRVYVENRHGARHYVHRFGPCRVSPLEFIHGRLRMLQWPRTGLEDVRGGQRRRGPVLRPKPH